MQGISLLAAQGRFDDARAQAMALGDTAVLAGSFLQLLDIGSVLMAAGFASDAGRYFDAARQLRPDDVRPLANLANVARDLGDATGCTALYSAALALQPDHIVMRRNLLVSQEYDDMVPVATKRAAAEAWGRWLAGHVPPPPRPAPATPLLDGAGQPLRPLRVGYVSADLCQHTVGLLAKDVLASHDPARVLAFAYHAGPQRDWVTEQLARSCSLRMVGALDDAALARQVQADGIDVLVDLSGHTAGSRLTMFARRPAPVQVSWLGYFATTGLAVMDAVLLDAAHAPPGAETQFTETVVRMPQGRWCYVPVPFMPPVPAGLPAQRNGHVTFGCFNNSAKLNGRVFDLWARLLLAVPTARLVLKWRTFLDPAYGARVREAFAAHGVDPARLDLRGPSFHVDALKEYGDIDIALDPFPFTGGLTSCEALWMGVPVVTWPQERVVSRQTLALLQTVGLPELAASDANDYLRIASTLAADLPRLDALHAGLRGRVAASPLCDAAGFTRGLEDVLWQLAVTRPHLNY
ncbi:MAG: O-linked N-acetylglucosamine transferase [Pseudomonadota bacterium]